MLLLTLARDHTHIKVSIQGGCLPAPHLLVLYYDQVFRLLAVPLSTQMLSDITSRLVEVICEPSEEMQGFVTEILQTLECSVKTLEINGICNYTLHVYG